MSKSKNSGCSPEQKRVCKLYGKAKGRVTPEHIEIFLELMEIGKISEMYQSLVYLVIRADLGAHFKKHEDGINYLSGFFQALMNLEDQLNNRRF